MVRLRFGSFTFGSEGSSVAVARRDKEQRLITEVLGPGGASIARIAEMMRRHAYMDDLVDLLEAGWQRDDVARLVDSWPNRSPRSLPFVFMAAVDAVRAGIGDPADATVWTHAMLVEMEMHIGRREFVQLVPREIVRTLGARGVEQDKKGFGFPRYGPFVETYLAATGDAWLALVSAAAGLTPEEAEDLDANDGDRMGELRAAAAERGIIIP